MVTDAAGGAGGGGPTTVIPGLDPHPVTTATERTRQRTGKQRGNMIDSKNKQMGEFNLCITRPPLVFACTSVSPGERNRVLQLFFATDKQNELLKTSDL